MHSDKYKIVYRSRSPDLSPIREVREPSTQNSDRSISSDFLKGSDQIFNRHLMGLVEEYRDRLISMEAQLRLEMEKNIKLQREVTHYKNAYKLNSHNQAGNAEFRREDANNQSENAKKESYVGDISNVFALRGNAQKYSDADKQVEMQRQAEGLEKKMAVVPRPLSRNCLRRRPNVGKFQKPQMQEFQNCVGKSSSSAEHHELYDVRSNSNLQTSQFKGCKRPTNLRRPKSSNGYNDITRNAVCSDASPNSFCTINKLPVASFRFHGNLFVGMTPKKLVVTPNHISNFL